MPRLSQQLHPHREPVTPLHAATVLLLRDAPQPGGGSTLQVLMTRRSDKASFVPGAYVFPGGGIETQDADPATHALADHRPAQTAAIYRSASPCPFSSRACPRGRSPWPTSPSSSSPCG